MDTIIRAAIANKQLLSFSYHGLLRIVEPHVYGVQSGKYQLLCFQVRGQSSSGRLPDWRRIDLSQAQNLRILDEYFPGRRPYPSGKHSSFDQQLAIVS
ncbi:MAG: hypothetical protein WCK70_01945 [Chloroflexales bacterium]